MPHQSFGTVRAGEEREPITFDFGLYGEETFTVVPTPSFGDTFDLHDAPEPTNTQNELILVRVLARFIRRLLPPEDRPRFDAALYRIPTDRPDIIIECAAWIAPQVTGFPTRPPTTSSGGRARNGRTSSSKRAGAPRSKR